MALRTFDLAGRTWEVWDVRPEVPARFVDHLATGWLCFACGDERRRIWPIPEEWEEWDQRRLVSALRVSTLMPPRTLAPAI